MAEAALSLTSFKKEFDDQLTCGVCLDQYTDPKMLPCQHTFCLNCIQQLPAQIKEGQYYISCPTCRVDHLTPEGGAINLPNAFQINTFMDLKKKLAISETAQQPITPSKTTTGMCPKHNDPLKVYCETCYEVICRDCTISKEHNTHNFSLISECYPKHHQQLQDSLDQIKHKMVDIDTAITDLATREEEVLQQGQHVKEQINTHAQQVIDQVQRSCTRLSQQVDDIVQQKTQVLTAQRQQAQKLHTKLKTCRDTIEYNLKECTEQQILMEKYTLMNRINAATQNADPAVFQPIESTDIKFAEENFLHGHVDYMHRKRKEIGFITSTIYGNAFLEVSPCQVNQLSTATLTLRSYNDIPFSPPKSLISSTLYSPGDKHTVKCDITWMDDEFGEYNIPFTPFTRGIHIMTVQVGGLDIPDSPYTIPVIPTPETRGKPVNIITGLNKPHGVAVCDNGDIVVAENGAHCITIINKNGKKVRSFGTMGIMKGQFIHPHEVAISYDRCILATDKHRIQKLTIDGDCVRSFSGYFTGGITVHSNTGQIFAADESKGIIVFNNDLNFLQTITHKQLKQPGDIALDKEGYLYIADNVNHCISVLNI